MSYSGKIVWNKVKMVVFDVDGTLYEQSKLRKKMLFALLGYYALRPWRLGEMRLLQRFRREREKHPAYAGPDVENAQYAWCAEGTSYPVAKIKRVVQQWIFDYPNQYLSDCTYPGVKEFFNALRVNHIKIGVYSDYKAHDKLRAMGLQADAVVASTDPEIDRLKPDPKGLLYLADLMRVAPEECLFIGDRPELDGACAERANMPYLIVEKQPFNSFNFYDNLTKLLTTDLKPTTTTYESDIYAS
ncbi:HAD family hydrolase [Hymenobacter jejuensis]|uniref:phosphoglycolate phosphatase n=1 Tax=Hymenobacter jejuensis TaxID=2502781 RepID=A0A5B8A708_9BACT|nr:HAD family hydrolase [Hymenobacter jejuensis]QDA62202.1 HAD family hydrolase [Hymenobacter jejuensis]